MSHDLVTAIIVSFFGFIFITVMSVAAFFAIRWIKSLDSTANKLSHAIDTLTTTVSNLDKKMDLLDRDIKGHDEAIMKLQGRNCPNPECPFFAASSEPLKVTRTRMGGLDEQD